MVSPGGPAADTGAYQTLPQSTQTYGSGGRLSHSDRVQTPACKSDIRERSGEPFSTYQRGQSETCAARRAYLDL